MQQIGAGGRGEVGTVAFPVNCAGAFSLSEFPEITGLSAQVSPELLL